MEIIKEMTWILLVSAILIFAPMQIITSPASQQEEVIELIN